jgi:hypothetical protein
MRGTNIFSGITRFSAILATSQGCLRLLSTGKRIWFVPAPRSTLHILEDSAHVPSDDAMIAALIQATEEIAEIGFKKK